MERSIADEVTGQIFDTWSLSDFEAIRCQVIFISSYLLELFSAYAGHQTESTVTGGRSSALLVSSIQRNSKLYIFSSLFFLVCFMNYVSLSFVLAYLLIIFRVLVNEAFSSLEIDVKWIKRESRLLRAIVEDSRQVMSLSDQIKDAADQMWHSDSGLSSSTAIIGLTEPEIAWVNDTEQLVGEAEKFVETYMKQRRQEIAARDLLSSLVNWKWNQIKKLLNEATELKKGINRVIGPKSAPKVRNVCQSLETSWSIIRKLLERPIEQHENKSVRSRLEASEDSSIHRSRCLVNGLRSDIQVLVEHFSSFDPYFIKLQVTLLGHFLKQIQGLKLESEIKYVWVAEIEEVLGMARCAIQAFLAGPGKSFWWFLMFSNWDAMQKLTEEMRRVYIHFYDLFNSKEICGFTFIRRDSSKSTHQSLRRPMDDPVTSPIIHNVREFLSQESLKLGEAYIKLASLCYQLEELLDSAKASERRNDPTVVSLKETIKYIAKMTENSVETFRTNAFQDGIKKARKRLSQESDRINYCLYLLRRSIAAYRIEFRDESSSVVGLEEDIHKVVSQLRACGESCSVVSIVGMEGIGKTTLGKKIYSHRAVVDHFHIRKWITLPPQNSNGDTILKDVAQQIMEKPLPDHNWKEQLKDFWKHKVSGSRFLLVLDNVSTEDAWEMLKDVFFLHSDGSKILLTTGNEEVASRANQTEAPHQLRLRTKEESLALFKQLLSVSPQEETTAKEIVDRCLGLPQAIIHVGYLTLWKHVTAIEMLRHLIQKNDREPLVNTFKTANKELPSHLKECLYYFRLFPRDFEIPVRRVVALWVAERLVVRGEDRKETPEDVANKYLSQLIDLNIIQVVKRKPSGKVKTCCLPVAMREFWLHKLQQEGVSSVQRLTDQFDSSDNNFGLLHRNSSTAQQDLRDYRDLHSFLSFDPREGNEPGEYIGNFLRRGIASGCFLRLQVLDLERVFRPELPNAMGKLKKLTYLGLRWTYIEVIPSSIGNLVFLETLDVKHTDLRTLPASVWKLPRLRHLYLNKSNRSKFIPHPGGSSLGNLKTLWNVFLDESNPLMGCLEKLINLRKLGLSMQLDLQEQRLLLAEGIAKMKHLRCLKLRSIDEMGCPCMLFLRLSGLDKLSVLHLFGRLENPSELAALPKNLTELTLSASSLSDDPMPVLETLSSLKLLCLYSNSYTGKRMVCSRGGFPQLLVLRIWKLEQLEEWEASKGSLWNLREFEIRSCTSLKTPKGLKNLKTLLELKLTSMPRAFTENIQKNKMNIWDDVAHFPSIITVDE